MTRRSLCFGLFQTHARFEQVAGAPGQLVRYGFIAGPAPTDTKIFGDQQDAVLYLDAADQKVKVLHADGTIGKIEQ